MGLKSGIITIKSRKRKRTISLSLGSDGRIFLRVPYHLTDEKIQEFLLSKREWLESKLKNLKEIKPRKFMAGEKFPYFGRLHPLRLECSEEKRPLVFSNDEFVLAKDSLDQARELFIAWYKNEAHQKLRERIDHYSGPMGLEAVPMKITSALCRWGSCSTSNTLNFPWRIAMLPLGSIDYIVVHELAHTKEKNHSEKFWKLVSLIMPDYKERKKWLNENGFYFAF